MTHDVALQRDRRFDRSFSNRPSLYTSVFREDGTERGIERYGSRTRSLFWLCDVMAGTKTTKRTGITDLMRRGDIEAIETEKTNERHLRPNDERCSSRRRCHVMMRSTALPSSPIRRLVHRHDALRQRTMPWRWSRRCERRTVTLAASKRNEMESDWMFLIKGAAATVSGARSTSCSLVEPVAQRHASSSLAVCCLICPLRRGVKSPCLWSWHRRHCRRCTLGERVRSSDALFKGVDECVL